MLRINVTERFKTDLNNWLYRHYETKSHEAFSTLCEIERDSITYHVMENAIELIKTQSGTVLRMPDKHVRVGTDYEHLPLQAYHFTVEIITPFKEPFELSWNFGQN